MPDNAEYRAKRHRLCEVLESAGLDGALLARRRNFSWLSCGAHNYVGLACDVGNSFLLADRTAVWAIANNIEAARLRHEELAHSPIAVVELLTHSFRYGLTCFALTDWTAHVSAGRTVAGQWDHAMTGRHAFASCAKACRDLN